jgi:hypothetical protein
MEPAKNPFKVEKDVSGCPQCGHGDMWTIVGPHGTQIGQSWGDQELVEDICQYMNEAFEAGLETSK